MAAASSDIKFYLSANRPEADTGTSGGARDATMQMLLPTKADIGGAGDTIDLVSASASDTQNVVLAGYGVGGAWVEETIALNGVTTVESTNTFVYLCKIQAASAAAGAVTVSQHTTPANVIHTIPIGEKGAARLFLKAVANAAGGAAKVLYEKVFVGNAHATDGITSAAVALTVNEASELAGALEKSATVQATGGTESVANRVTKPTGGDSYTWADMATPLAMGDAADGNLIAGEWQGLWLRATLAAGRTPTQHTDFTLQATGTAS